MKKTVFGASLRVLALSSLGIVLCIMLPAFFLMDSLYYEVNAKNLSDTAELFLLLKGGDITLFFEEENNAVPPWLSVLKENTSYRITLVFSDGKVGFDTHVNPLSMENHQSRPEVANALSGIKGYARRHSASIGEEQLYVALPVFSVNEKIPIGVFRLSRNIPSFVHRISSSAVPFLVLVIAVAAAAFCAVLVFSRSLSRAVDRLVAITKTAGNLPSAFGAMEFPYFSDTEEFVKVEAALQDMAAELRSRIEQTEIENRRLEAILNGMTEAVFAVDSFSRLILINRQARLLFGISQDSEQTGSAPNLLEASGSTELDEAAQKVFASWVPLEFEMKWYKGGKRMTFQVYAAPFGMVHEGITPNGKNIPGGVVIVLNDITRLQKLEQVRKDFAANVSHELRTPIQVVKGFSETILDLLKSGNGQDREPLIRSVELIYKNAGTMENLTRDLLTLVSLEDDSGMRPEMAVENVKSLMEEVVQLVEGRRREKNITINQSCPPGFEAKLHASLIIQALTNLLENAIKYSPQETEIRFEAAAEKTDDGKKELVLSVKDQGMGIPAEHLGRIFERFYRVDKARSREAGGTGLGLSIVRHIALAHNGTAEASSHAGEGSVFTLRIPFE